MRIKFPLIVLSFVFLLIFLSSFSIAAPPFQTSDTGSGLQIEYPKYEFLRQYTSQGFHIHVINDTRSMNVTHVSCSLHIYNQTGWHIGIYNLLPDSTSYLDFDTTISSSNLSSLGVMSYVVQCNSTTQIAFASGQLVVTTDGQSPATSTNFFLILISLCLVILTLGIVFENYILGFLSGLLFLITGTYTMIYGFATILSTYSRMVAAVIIGIGMIITIVSSLELTGVLEGGGEEESDEEE